VAEHLVVATAVPDIRVISLLELKVVSDPIRLQERAFQLAPALHVPLIIVMMDNRRLLVLNTFTGQTAGELRLAEAGHALTAPRLEVALKAEAPPDENGVQTGTIEVAERSSLPGPAFMAFSGGVATAMIVGTDVPPHPPPSAVEPSEGGGESVKDDEPSKEEQRLVEDPGECIDEDAVETAPVRGQPAKPKVEKTTGKTGTGEVENKPRRYLFVAGAPSLAVFDLQDINSKLAPEEEDVLGGKPMMIHRMLAEPMEEFPPPGMRSFPLDDSLRSTKGGRGDGSRRPVSRHAQFVRGVTPQTGAKRSGAAAAAGQGGSRDGQGPALLAVGGNSFQGTNRSGASQEYEPSDAGTGVSGATAAAGEGVGIRTVKPIPGAAASVAERVLGKLGESGGRRTRNRVIRKTMRELADKMLQDSGGQRPYLAPTA